MEMSFQTNFTNPIIKLGNSLEVSVNLILSFIIWCGIITIQQFHVNELRMRVGDRSIMKKLLIGYNSLSPNFKFSDPSKNTLGAKHSMHGEPVYTASKVILFAASGKINTHVVKILLKFFRFAKLCMTKVTPKLST